MNVDELAAASVAHIRSALAISGVGRSLADNNADLDVVLDRLAGPGGMLVGVYQSHSASWSILRGSLQSYLSSKSAGEADRALQRDIVRIIEATPGLAHEVSAVLGEYPGPPNIQLSIHGDANSPIVVGGQNKVSQGSVKGKERWPLVVGIPPRKSEVYQDRPELLSQLDQGPVGKPFILTGAGGVGKSQLAAQYFRNRVLRGVDLALWVNASSRSTILQAYAEAYESILEAEQGSRLREAGRVQDRAADFLNWLEFGRDRTWLIVLDSIDKPEDLYGDNAENVPELWPVGANGTVIATTRLAFRSFLQVGQAIQIGTFTEEQALAYLQETVDFHDGGVAWVEEDAKRLVNALQCLPLALSLCGAILVDQQLSLAEYSKVVSRTLEFAASTQPRNYGRTVATAWSPAVEGARARDPLSYPALVLAAVLDFSNAPLEIWLSKPGGDFLRAYEANELAQSDSSTLDEARIRQALVVLRSFNLINFSLEDPRPRVETHVFGQEATRQIVRPEAVRDAVRAAAMALIDLWDSFQDDAVLRANENALIASDQRDVLWEDGCRELLFRVGDSLRKDGLIVMAREHFTSMVEQATRRLGLDHEDTYRASYALALSLGEQGDPQAAAEAFERLKGQQEKVLGERHPVTLRTSHRLAVWRGHAGDPQAAKDALERICQTMTEVIGVAFDERIEALSDHAYWTGVVPGGAKDAVRQFMDLEREYNSFLRELSPEESQTLDRLRSYDLRANLGQFLGEAGEWDDAVSTYRTLIRDLASDRRYGPTHPRTLQARHGLCWWMATGGTRQGDSAKLRQAVHEFGLLEADKLRVLGPAHRDTLLVRRDRAWWAGQSGEPARSVADLLEITSDMKRYLSPRNPESLIARRNTAVLQARSGDVQGGLSSLKQLRAEASQFLSDEHPDVRILMDELKALSKVRDFQVWAPGATSVEVVLYPAAGRIACVRSRDGWWKAEVPGAGHETDYWFSVDGADPRPDPRSGWQPYGVHGPSRVFDPDLYPWRNPGWPGRPSPNGVVHSLLGGVFYELHVGTFTPSGTLISAINRLDELVDLGVDVVELLPLAEFDGNWGWGYDGVDLYAVHRAYGGPVALQRFVDACHARGLAVCLDVVYNHVGASGNYLSYFGPYFTVRNTPWGEAINLDGPGSQQVRRWICDNALRWFSDFRVDALRLDAVHALRDESKEHLLCQLSREVSDLSKRLGRPLTLIAESDLNDPRLLDPCDAPAGRGMAAVWNDDVHHAVHALLTREDKGYYVDFGSVDVLSYVLKNVYWHDGKVSTFRGNVRWGLEVDTQRYSGDQFVVAMQTHDQIGNRATGDRIGSSISRGRLAIGAAIILTSPYTPLLFMGEEWGAKTPWRFFTNFGPELGVLVRDGRRREFARYGWREDDVPDPQDPGTRDRSILQWEERTDPENARMLQWYQELIALRRTESDIESHDLSSLRVTKGPFSDAHGQGWLVIHRGSFDLMINLTSEPVVMNCPDGSTVKLAWEDPEKVSGGYRIPADCVVIIRRPDASHPVHVGG